MFVAPRTWRQGESGIRFDSLNKSLPLNLEEFKKLMNRRVGAVGYDNSSFQIRRTAEASRFTVSDMFNFNNQSYFEPLPTTDAGFTIFPGATRITSFTQPVVTWVPFKSINEAKKSSENIYFQVFAVLYYLPDAAVSYEIDSSRVEYSFLGSDLNTSFSSAADRIVSWNSSLSSFSLRNNLMLTTGKVLFDTSVMTGGTNPSLAAFRFKIRQHALTTIPKTVARIAGDKTATFITRGDNSVAARTPYEYIGPCRIRVDIFVE